MNRLFCRCDYCTVKRSECKALGDTRMKATANEIASREQVCSETFKFWSAQ